MTAPIELLTIIAAAKKETAKAVKDAMPAIADMVRREVDAKEIKTIADVAATIKGDKGDKGDVGPKGEDGKDGLNGRDGKDGANGKDGKDGKDAIAKDGKDGRNGTNGINGKDGVGIAEVAIGDDGHLYVGLTSGKVIDAGQARGEDGKPGKDGKTIIGGGGGGGSAVALASKQDTLVSGVNIKTINGNSLLGSGDLVISGGSGGVSTSETAPLSPSNGDIWFKTSDGSLSVYYDDGDTSQWVVVSGASSVAGNSGFVFVASKADLPAPSAGVINLEAGATYYFTEIVDLTGDRLVCGANTTLLGASSENSGIRSTGIVGAALITSAWSLPIRHLQLEAAKIFDLDATGNANQALDWYGVNLLNTSNIGTIKGYTNFVVGSMAFLSASGLVFDGTVGTIGFSNTLFQAASGTIITVPATATISRRVRIIYSSFVVTGTATALNVSASASIPDEGYILDTVNFSGGGTYVSGVQYSDNKSLFVNNKGILNSSALVQYYMQNNATASDVVSAGVSVKVAGTTTASPLVQRFTHAANRATYSGALVRNFKVMCTSSLTAGNNEDIGLYIAKNGSILTESEQYVTTSASGRIESVTIMTLVSLSTNDYIEIFTENASSSADITVTYMNVIAEALN